MRTLSVGQQAQQHGVDDAEDGARRANPERERHDGGRGECPIADETADGIRNVTVHVFQPKAPAHCVRYITLML
jgi:hypothetical protein